MAPEQTQSTSNKTSSVPLPPLPCPSSQNFSKNGFVTYGKTQRGHTCVDAHTNDLWERLFDEGYRADVAINTDGGGIIYAHASVLGLASPVLKRMLKGTKKNGHLRSISIRGVPYSAIQVFVRFLYSSCYELEELEEHALHLLVLSHAYMIPNLKKVCEQRIEHGLLNIENVVDTFQLALLCDAPRLSLICHRLILKNFKSVSSSDGWKAMKTSHPVLEKLVLNSKADAEFRKKESERKLNEKKTYLQLYEAMEALVHICKDGCRTIGPQNKAPKEHQGPCKYLNTCQALESLLRHFAGCKLRVPGGCVHCKRMWQLFELHSHLCVDSDVCRVPLCRCLLFYFSIGKCMNGRDSVSLVEPRLNAFLLFWDLKCYHSKFEVKLKVKNDFVSSFISK